MTMTDTGSQLKCGFPSVRSTPGKTEDSVPPKPIRMSVEPLIQRQPIEEEKEEEEEVVQAKQSPGHSPTETPAVTTPTDAPANATSISGQSLRESERTFFEPRFGYDFSRVRLHTDSRAITRAQALNARAYTVGRNIMFGAGQYRPGTYAGQLLLAHELTHVVQQSHGTETGTIQRQLGVGRDLKSARFSGDPVLERVFDGQIEIGNTAGRTRTGRAVRLIQESLLDQNYALPNFGADGKFGNETEAAVRQFQIDAGATVLDGIINEETMRLLDMHDSGATAGVNLTAARFVGNAVLEQVLDGNRLLRVGSRGNAVQLVEESLVAMGLIVGPAGPDPDYDNDTKAAVEQFQGQVGARVDGIIGPETMAFLDQHDPGGTAGAGLATGAVFSESGDEDFAGYDDSVAPNWLVVPVGGRRRPDVATVPAGARPSYVSNTPTVATVQNTEEGAVVSGVARGVANVDAMAGGVRLDRLRISVKDPVHRTVGYHFMRDTAALPQPQHVTARTAADVNPMTSLLNRCWERQANVRFRSGTADTPQLGGNIPDIRTTTVGGLDWPTVVAHATGEDYNVFLIWSLIVTNLGNVHPNGGTDGAGNTLVEDAAPCGDGLTLPHEAGHFLGIHPHTGTGLMQACASGRVDRRVTKAQADIVNP